MTNDERNHFGTQILDASIAVHRELGPGLLESVYELALMQELRKKGLGFAGKFLCRFLTRE